MAPRARLIGRDQELAVLAGLVETVAAGRGGVVLVEGEPGIGKSALVTAALAGATGLGCQVFWGTGGELDQALPLQPLLDGLRVRDTAANPRREAIARLLRGEAATDRGMDGSAVLAEQLLALIAEECIAHPMVLVIDDLQWADQASIRLLGRLAASARDLPLLLVWLMRPVPQREDLLGLRRAADPVRLQLAGLTETAAADLVAFLVGGTPDSRLLQLAGDAAGNPLYITELIAALERGSMLTITDDGTAALAAGPTPRSLAAAINDRLGFISGPTREILRSASLLGTQFTVTDLASIVDRGIGDLAWILREACAAGILTESGNCLRFRHPLIHAALHEEMSAPIRTAMHRDAGRALAAAGASADRVARQLLSATGEPDGPPELLEEWMLSWLDGAADALVSQAPPVAAALLSQAVDSLPAGSPLHGRLASRLANALFHVGENGAAEQLVGRVLEHATDPDLLVDLHWTLALCRTMAGQSAEALAALGCALAEPGLSPRHCGRLLVLTARTQAMFGELEKAGRTAASALTAAEAGGDTWAIGWATHVLAFIAILRGKAAEALSLYDRGLAVTQATPELADLRLLLQINQAGALADLGRHEEALAAAGRTFQLAAQVGTTIRLGQAHCLLGQMLYEAGRWDEALYEMAVVPQSLKEPTTTCEELGITAAIAFHRGDAPSARGHISAAMPHAQRIGHRLIPTLVLARSLEHEQTGALPEALATLTGWLDGGTEELVYTQDLIADATRLAMRIGNLETARVLASQATESAMSSQTPCRQANALYCQGLLEHDGPLLLAAAEHYRHACRPLQRAMALEAAASEQARGGDTEEARAALASAAEVYTELGAAMDLARVNAAWEALASEAHPAAGS